MAVLAFVASKTKFIAGLKVAAAVVNLVGMFRHPGTSNVMLAIAQRFFIKLFCLKGHQNCIFNWLGTVNAIINGTHIKLFSLL